MWNPVNIQIKNLGSIRDIDYKFLTGKVRNIQGINDFDEGQENNGSGKSLLPEAQMLCLVGETIRGESVYEMINNSENICNLTFNLVNPTTNSTLTIQRIFTKSSKKHEVNLWINNQPDKQSSTSEYDKRILELIGISKDDLQNYFIIHKEKFKAFFISSDTIKKEIINRFSGGFLIKVVDTYIKEDIKIVENKLYNIDTSLSNLDTSINIYNNQILEIKTEDLEKARQEVIDGYNLIGKDYIYNIENCERDIALWNKDIIKSKYNIIDINKYIDTQNQEKLIYQNQNLKLDKPKDTTQELQKINTEEQQFIQIKNNIFKLNSEKSTFLTQLKQQLGQLENKLHNIIKCPKCEHEFSLQEKGLDINLIKTIQIPNLQKDIKIIGEEIENNNNDKLYLETEINNLNKLKEQLRKAEQEYNKLKFEIEQKINSIDRLIQTEFNKIEIEKSTIKTKEQFIKQANDNIVIYNEKITQIENNILEEKAKKLIHKPTTQIEEKIKDCNNKKDVLIKEKSDLELERQEINEWLILMGRFSTYLSNKSLKAIESYTNYYLQKIGSDIEVILEGERMLADNKSIREEIDVAILRNGVKQSGTFKKYSSGEKTRLIIANILALKGIINNSCKNGGGLEYLNADELIESLDPLGIKLLFKSLSNLNETIDIVTFANNNIIDIDTVIFHKQPNGVTVLQ